MNQEEIKYKIETDPNFAIDFALDNNLPFILTLLRTQGYSGSDRAFAKQVLVSLLNAGEYKKVQEILNQTPYDDSAPNYTGSMKSYFTYGDSLQKSAYASQAGRFDLTAFLGALGSGLTTYSSATSTGGVIGNPGQLPPPQKDFSWIWWVLGGIVVLVIILVIIKKKKK